MFYHCQSTCDQYLKTGCINDDIRQSNKESFFVYRARQLTKTPQRKRASPWHGNLQRIRRLISKYSKYKYLLILGLFLQHYCLFSALPLLKMVLNSGSASQLKTLNWTKKIKRNNYTVHQLYFFVFCKFKAKLPCTYKILKLCKKLYE